MTTTHGTRTEVRPAVEVWEDQGSLYVMVCDNHASHDAINPHFPARWGTWRFWASYRRPTGECDVCRFIADTPRTAHGEIISDNLAVSFITPAVDVWEDQAGRGHIVCHRHNDIDSLDRWFVAMRLDDINRQPVWGGTWRFTRPWEGAITACDVCLADARHRW